MADCLPTKTLAIFVCNGKRKRLRFCLRCHRENDVSTVVWLAKGMLDLRLRLLVLSAPEWIQVSLLISRVFVATIRVNGAKLFA